MIGNVLHVCSSLSQEMEELNRGSAISGHSTTQQTPAAMHHGLWHVENSLFDDCECVASNTSTSDEFGKDWQQTSKLNKLNTVRQSWRLLQPAKCYQKSRMTDSYSTDVSQELSQLDSCDTGSTKELAMAACDGVSESHSIESLDSGVESVSCSELNSSSDSLLSFTEELSTDDVNDSLLKTPSGFYEKSLNVPSVRIPPLFDYPGRELSTIFSESESVSGTERSDGSVMDDWSRVGSDVDSDSEGTEVSEQDTEDDVDRVGSTVETLSARVEESVGPTTVGDTDVETNTMQLYEHLVLNVLQKVLSDVTTLSLDSQLSTSDKSVDPTTQLEDGTSHPGSKYLSKCNKSTSLNPLAPSFNYSAKQPQRSVTPISVVPLTGYGPSLPRHVAPQCGSMYWTVPVNWVPYVQVYGGTSAQSQQAVKRARDGYQRPMGVCRWPMYVQPYYVVRPNYNLNAVYPVVKPSGTGRLSTTKKTASRHAGCAV